MTSLTKEQVNNIANGACFLASGGGGPLEMAYTLIENTFADKGEGATISVATVQEASQDTDHLTAMICYIGAPSTALFVQKPLAAFHAFDRLNQYCQENMGKSLGYVIPIEIGAVSTVAPCLVALEKSTTESPISVVDGDGAGRAVPELTMTTFASHGVSADPAVVANDEKVVGLLDIQTAGEAEELIRPFIGAELFHEHAGLAMWVMDGPTLAEAVPIRGTLTLAEDIGSNLKTIDHPASTTPVEDVMEILTGNGLKAHILYNNWLIKGNPFWGTAQRGGFDLGQVVLEPDLQMVEETVNIYYKNESLIAWSSLSSAPIAMAPDSICYLQADGATFSNDPLLMIPDKMVPVNLIGIVARPELQVEPISGHFATVLANNGFGGSYTPIGGWVES